MSNLEASHSDPEQPMSRDWHWFPDLPIRVSSLFSLPVNVLNIAYSLLKPWLTFSTTTFWTLITLGVWFWATPAAEVAQSWNWEWVSFVFARNLILITLVAGGLHLYFYTFKLQGKNRRYEMREFAENDPKFTFKNQIYDNIFWTLVSGITICTAFEVLYLWLWANAYIPTVTVSENPVWFFAFFILLPLWSSTHFYFAHRFLHWKPMYDHVHSLHHRNVHVGPWSGMSMHPVEHVLYLSSFLIHFVVPSDPAHFIFHICIIVLSPPCAHAGYDAIMFGKRKILPLGDFFHQLHHRHFECNYGSREIPWDVWYKSFHDGTSTGTKAMRDRQRAKRKAKAG